MFRRRERLVLIPIQCSGTPGMVPFDDPTAQPAMYPDFFDTMWYIRRLREWSLEQRSTPPNLYWLTPSQQDHLLGEKGMRNVSYWLSVFTGTIRQFEQLERELQAGECFDANTLLQLKGSCSKLWQGLDAWLTASN